MAESLVFQTGSIAPPSINIPAGSQSFTSNGTFTAPYDGVYTVAITAPIAKGGNGANGVDGYANMSFYGPDYPTGGGAGGSAYIAIYPLILIVRLIANESVAITVNSSVASFGTYGSFAAGTAGGDGTSGTINRTNPTQGTGGSGGSKPIPTAAAICLASIVPTIPTLSLSGGNGTYNGGSISENNVQAAFHGATGGKPSTNFGNSGGIGGEGSGVLTGDYGNYVDADGVIATSVSACNGLPAQIGRIDITWGNSNK